MIAKITGKIIQIAADYVVVEAGALGYKVQTPNPYQYGLNQEATFYTHLSVREDALELYGFSSLEAKDLFVQLITVTGIGPKTACGILAFGDVERVTEAIERGDTHFLMSVPKIGPKTAQQIILDLKGKLHTEVKTSNNPALDDALEALRSLGYKDKEIQRIIKHLQQEKLTTQEYITKALQLMHK